VRQLGRWLLAKNFHAAVVGFLCALLPLFTLPGDFFASILVAFVTLRKGAKSGLVVLMWIALPGIALLALGQLSLFDVLWVRCVLVWGLALLLRRTGSWQYVLYLMTIIGLLGVSFFHVWMGDPVSFWMAKLSAYVLEMSKAFSLSSDVIAKNVETLAAFATGMMVFVVLIGLFLQMLIARYWQAALFNPGGLRQEAMNIRVDVIGSTFFLLALVLALFKVPLVIDMLPVLVLPFAIAGLSLLHMVAYCHSGWKPALVVLYVALFFMPYLSLVLALFGVSDVWLNYRKRWQLFIPPKAL
jgi:hypothetical protein